MRSSTNATSRRTPGSDRSSNSRSKSAPGGEISCACIGDDVDLKGRSVLLRGVKNSRNPEEIIDVLVGLSPRALEILKALPRSLDGRVFPITANALKSAFNRARHKLGLDHYRFHDTRHELHLVAHRGRLVGHASDGAIRSSRSEKPEALHQSSEEASRGCTRRNSVAQVKERLITLKKRTEFGPSVQETVSAISNSMT